MRQAMQRSKMQCRWKGRTKCDALRRGIRGEIVRNRGDLRHSNQRWKILLFMTSYGGFYLAFVSNNRIAGAVRRIRCLDGLPGCRTAAWIRHSSAPKCCREEWLQAETEITLDVREDQARLQGREQGLGNSHVAPAALIPTELSSCERGHLRPGEAGDWSLTINKD